MCAHPSVLPVEQGHGGKALRRCRSRAMAFGCLSSPHRPPPPKCKPNCPAVNPSLPLWRRRPAAVSVGVGVGGCVSGSGCGGACCVHAVRCCTAWAWACVWRVAGADTPTHPLPLPLLPALQRLGTRLVWFPPYKARQARGCPVERQGLALGVKQQGETMVMTTTACSTQASSAALPSER